MIERLRVELARLARGNAEYAEFNKRIVKTDKVVLGVRTPDMKKLAKETARGMDFAGVNNLLDEVDAGVYEEVLLAGMVINYAKISEVEKLELTERYLGMVDNWAHVDGFVEVWRRKYDRKLWWDYSLRALRSDAEFVVRYGVICLMSNYLDEEYITATLDAVRTVKHEGYYVKMGLAWLYATAAVRDFERVMGELGRKEVEPWVRKKAYQKMLESYRITDAQKAEIRLVR